MLSIVLNFCFLVGFFGSVQTSCWIFFLVGKTSHCVDHILHTEVNMICHTLSHGSQRAFQSVSFLSFLRPSPKTPLDHKFALNSGYIGRAEKGTIM